MARREFAESRVAGYRRSCGGGLKPMSEFLESYGLMLLRPLTGVTVNELFQAFVGYMRGDYSVYNELYARDQLAVLAIVDVIEGNEYELRQINEDDLRSFNPNKGRKGELHDWQNDCYVPYIKFVNRVAERVGSVGAVS